MALTATPVPSVPDDVHVYDIGETADRLRISRAGLYNLLARGEMPSIKIGGRRMVRAADLRNFIDTAPTS